MGTGSFPGVKRPGRGVGHLSHLAPRFKKSRAIPLLHLWAFVACYRVIFTFTFNTYKGADKSLAWLGSKQANVSVRMAWISFGALPCRGGKKNLMTARVSMLLKSRASLTCFRACFHPGRAKDSSAPRYTDTKLTEVSATRALSQYARHSTPECSKCLKKKKLAFSFRIKVKKYLGSALFWDFTQHRNVVCYRRFGTTYRSRYDSQALRLLDLGDGAYRSSLNVDNKLQFHAA